MLPLFAAAGLALVANGPRPVLVTNVRRSTDANAPSVSILVRNGRIERVADGALEAPVDARRVDGEGALVLPAFVDAYSFTGCATPEPKSERDLPAKAATDVYVDMRAANRRGIQPAFRAADVFDAGEALEGWRTSGFGALLSAPAGQLLSGSSALVVTREAAPRDAIVRARVFDHAGFRSTGSGYPGTLMGGIAQLRQFFLDARWHADLQARRAAGKAGARPPFDADLEAAQDALAKRRVVCCAADEVGDVERFVALGDELGFDVAIVGGREAWKRARLLAERKIAVVLTPAGGDEPDDPDAKDGKSKTKAPKAEDAPWTYAEPVATQREKRRTWTEDRDGARVLAEAGVRIAFGTGKDKPKELLERVRKLVAAGLPRDVALKALTDGAAAIVGAAPALGRIAEGSDATFALWTKDPLVDEKAVVAWLFVDGYAHEFDVDAAKAAGAPDDGVEATGDWTAEFDAPDAPKAKLELRMEKDGAVEGTVRGTTPDGVAVEFAVTGAVRGRQLELEGRADVGGQRMQLKFAGELSGDTWKGTLDGFGPAAIGFTAQRTPKGAR